MREGGYSPLQARQDTSFLLFFIIIFSLIALLILISFLIKLILNKHKTPEYIQKEKERPTKKKDIIKLQKEFNLSDVETKYLKKICLFMNPKNIYYLFKDLQDSQEFFKTTYHKLKNADAPDEDINELFKISYKIESFYSKSKQIHSTKQIPLSSTVNYITKDAEKFPFFLVKNTPDAFSLEIPEFFYHSPNRPKELDKIPFTYISKHGYSYHFSSRIIRFSPIPNSDKFLMVINHCNNIYVQIQRHYKREIIECDAFFSPIRVSKNYRTSEDIFIHSDKQYKGKLINISGGGCCLKTILPIREGQNMGIRIPSIGINSPIVGTIKKTRRLTDGKFALHIQFIQFSIEEQNKILAFVYKYDL